jgi:hypothetical protein
MVWADDGIQQGKRRELGEIQNEGLWEEINSKGVFIVQKRIIRSIMNANPRASCRGFFNF